MNYSLEEFANDVVYMMQEISRSKGVEEPDIYTESGRYIAASHAILIAPVLELFSREYHESGLRLKESNPPLIQELNELYHSMQIPNAKEYLHDALDHMESLLTLFDLGYIDLEDRSNAEILVNLIIKKAIVILKDESTDELLQLQNRIQEKYLVNFSLFQSLPDRWGIDQSFPMMPISNLSSKPTRAATVWDITCDSDGEISFDTLNPLRLHDVDLEKEEYFLAFFLVGAYQEILGMDHNLFTHPTEAVVGFGDDGSYYIDTIVEAEDLIGILYGLGYGIDEITQNLHHHLETSVDVNESQRGALQDRLNQYMCENSYLKTIQSYQDKTTKRGR
jgi:arginine decarboxylase